MLAQVRNMSGQVRNILDQVGNMSPTQVGGAKQAFVINVISKNCQKLVTTKDTAWDKIVKS